MAILAPYISPYNPNQIDPNAILQGPSFHHLLGTNEVGQDILSLVIWGSRVSLLVGFLATAVAITVGTTIGVAAGYFGTAADEVLMRLTDFFLVVPAVVLAIIVAALLGNSLLNVVLIIGLLSWPPTARIVRSSTLVYKHAPFVEASKVAGASSIHILRTHILPNVMPLVYANTALTIANAIFTQSALVFLGVGDINNISWGQTLHFAYSSGAITAGDYWYAIPPGLMIVLAVLGFALAGYSLDEAFNPRLKGGSVFGSA
ncbi:MAG: ABC transporter permease [Candidatus Marsarchaeota archaeon]|nr:ABC transporter permease [Candidatus Marsarchaeota archaeon]